ncbi:MAG: hypothetical protein WCC60_21435 [Ilumatobacteraceae bacterium]
MGLAHMADDDPRFDDDPAPSSPRWLLPVVLLLALVCSAALTWRAVGDGDDDPVVSPATTASSLVELTIPPPPASVAVLAVAAPNPPVYAGPGAAYAPIEPLPGGLQPAVVQPYLVFAQQVFDQLAADDWGSALGYFSFQPDGGMAAPVAADDLQQQWLVSDRLSLLLLDATLDPNGVAYVLRVAVVANVVNATTSLMCGRLYVEIAPDAKVIQRGQFATVAEGEPWYQPEDLLAQPDRIAALAASCP